MRKKKDAEAVEVVKEDPGSWVPICKIASAYDFDEATGRYSDSTGPVELRQNTKTKEVQAFAI